MFCQNCGAELPDNAKFCPECGKSLTNSFDEEEEAEGTLTIIREKAFYAEDIKTKIYLDGEQIGAVKSAGYQSFFVSSGEHILELRTPMNRGVQLPIIIKEDRETTVAFKLSLTDSTYHKITKNGIYPSAGSRQAPAAQSGVYSDSSRQRCPRCGGNMSIQTVSESRKSGCGTVILYILLALTIFGLLIVIPLMLRKKTVTTTYAVCQNCGYRKKLSSQ